MKATAKAVIDTLGEHGISVHFGTSNSFANAYAVKVLFRYFWEDCGITQVDVYNVTDQVTQLELTVHERLEEEYRANRADVLGAIRQMIPRLNEARRSYAVIIPEGTDEDFSPMTDTAGKPGYINILKVHDADNSKYVGFEYCPPEQG